MSEQVTSEVGSDSTPFFFMIPLRPSAFSEDWSETLAFLRRTLQSVLAQSRPDFRVVIACQEHPGVPEMQDPRVHWLQVPFAKAKGEVIRGGTDKRLKVIQMGAYIKSLNLSPVYGMFLDADDAVSKNLVKHVLSDDNRNGYVISSGYFLDTISKNLRLVTYGFWGSCGSSFIGYFKDEDLPKGPRDGWSYFGRVAKHTQAPEVAKQEGRAPVWLPFPAVVYLMNHASSLQTQRHNKVRMGRGVDVAGADAARILTEEFSFSPEEARLSAPELPESKPAAAETTPAEIRNGWRPDHTSDEPGGRPGAALFSGAWAGLSDWILRKSRTVGRVDKAGGHLR